MPKNKWVNPKSLSARERADKELERRGLMKYQTKDLSPQEIAQRYADARVKTNSSWFKDTYGVDAPEVEYPRSLLGRNKASGPKPRNKWVNPKLQGYRERMDHYLEQHGLMKYQTENLSAAEIADRYAKANVTIAGNSSWFKDTYGFDPPDVLTSRQKMDEWRKNPTSLYPSLTQPQGMSGSLTPTGNQANAASNNQAQQAQLNPYANDFDWTKLSVKQKQAIVKTPDFQMSKVAAPGQQGLILSDQTFGLWSPNKPDAQYDANGYPMRGTYGQTLQKEGPTTYGSQDLQWWQPMAFSVLSDPKTQPAVQGLAMIALGGATGGVQGAAGMASIAVPMTVMAYGANWKGDENPIKNTVGTFSAWVLKGLMAGAIMLEQTQGVIDYLSGGKAREIRQVGGGEILAGAGYIAVSHAYQTGKAFIETGRLQEFISDPNLRTAVWEAGKVYYETLGSKQQPFTKTLEKILEGRPDKEDTIKAINAVLPLVKDENQVWVLGENEPVPVQPGYTLEDAVQRILKGESADALLGEYQRVYGISGVASDFMLQSIFDPLNVVPHVVGKTKAKIVDKFYVDKLGALEKLGTLSEKQAARLKIEKMKAEIYRSTPGVTGMAVPWNEASRRFKEIIKVTPGVAEHLTWGERLIAGVTPDGKVKELLPNQPLKPIPIISSIPIIKKVPGWLQTMFTLQPEARANLFRDKLAENMQVAFDWAVVNGKTDPKAMIDVVEAASKLDMETLRDAGAEFMGSPEAYTTIGAARDVLPKLRSDQLAYETLAPNREQFQNVAGIIGDDPKLILEGFLADDARPMVERLREKLKTAETPEAKALLKAFEEGKITAESLKNDFKPLENAPLNDIEFMARINNRMLDHLKEWGKDYFQIKDHNVWDESLRLLKGAQSLLLLDINPQSILNDFVNERVMLLTEGTLGLTSGKKIEVFKKEFGVWPEAAGGSGLLGDIATETTKLSASMKENKSLVGKAADKLNLFRSKLPRSQAASRFNAAHHDQMAYAGIKEYWGNNWIEGKGFDRMPASLEARLREYNVDPQVVYRNARSVLKPEQLELLKTRATSHDIGNYIADAAEKVGKTPGELTGLMERMGILDELRTGLEGADTPLKREQVFEGVEAKVQDYIDRRIVQEIPGRIQDYIDKIKTEAHGGAMQIYNEVAMQNFDTRLEVDKIWDDAFAKANEIDDYAVRQKIKRDAAQKADIIWRRTQTRQATLYTAATEALGFRDEFRVNYLRSLGEQHGMLRDYFTEKNRAIEKFFNTEFKSREARSVEWYSLEADLNQKFAETQSKTLKIQEGMNDLFVDEIRAKYGEAAAENANAWTANTLTASTDMHEMIVSFRKSIQGMDVEQRANAWERFKPEYQAAYRERMKVDMEGAAKVWKDETPLSPPVPDGTSPQTDPSRQSLGGEAPAKKAPTAKELAEIQKQRRIEEAMRIAERLAPVWDVAERYVYGDAPFNRKVDSASLLAVLRKEEYGGIRDLALNDPRLTPELAGSVLETRNQIKKKITEPPVRIPNDVITKPRSELDPRLSEIFMREAVRIRDVILGGEPGQRQFSNGEYIGTTKSTYPSWYSELQASTGGKKKLITALEKIIEDRGRDKGIVVERVKEFLSSNFRYGDLETGNPPSLSFLKLLGAEDAVLQDALNIFNDQMRTGFTLDQVLQIETVNPQRISIPEAESRLREIEVEYGSLKKDKEHAREYQKQLSEIQDKLIALEQSVPDEAPVTLQAQLISAQKNISTRLEVVENYLKAKETIGFLDALDSDPKSPLFEDATQPSDPRALFKDGGDLPLLPPGAYDQMASRMDATKIFEDGWSDQIRPALEAMKESANSPERRYSFKDMDAQTQKELNQYVTNLNGKMSSVKHAASKWGEVNAEYGLLNYDRQYGFDKLLSAFVPYEFFATRSAMNWFARVMDRPAFISQYVRFMNLRKTYVNDLPERMRGKMWIPNSFLPEWAGGGMWINPTYQLIPFTQFIQPLQVYNRDRQYLVNNAMYVLQDMADKDPSIKQGVIKAMQTQSGPIWERALAQATAENESTNSGADYFSMLFSPALYMSIPYYLATKKKLFGIDSSWPSGQLPITRVGSAMETAFKGTGAEWIGDIAGMLARPEKALRKDLSLSEFGEWGEYYIERQLVNMAAEDGYDIKQVHKALIEKSGPLYEEATNRVRYELMLKVPGMAPLYALAHGATLDKVVGALLTSLYPGGLLPPAEMEYKGLKQEFNQAWEAKKKGDKEPMRRFFDEHPEYSVRLALRDDPDERMQQFLKSEIWDAFLALGKTDAKLVNAELGPEFQSFLDSEPGREFSTEQLVEWVRALNGMVPKEPLAPGLDTRQPDAATRPPLQLYDPNVTAVTDQFFMQRSYYYPNFYKEEQGYWALPKSERTKYLLKTPGLKEYWDWKDKWYKKYPQYVPIFKGDVFDRVDTSTWPPMLESFVSDYAYTGKPLGSGAYKALEQVWIMEGQPMDSLQSWLDSVVAPAMMYGPPSP